MLLSNARARLWISNISLPVAGCGYDARYAISAPLSASARAFSGYDPSLAIMTPNRPISVSATGQNASRVLPYLSIHQSRISCGQTECSTKQRRDLVVTKYHLAAGIENKADVEEAILPL